MLLIRSDTLPQGPDWASKLKLDGYRALGIKILRHELFAETFSGA